MQGGAGSDIPQLQSCFLMRQSRLICGTLLIFTNIMVLNAHFLCVFVCSLGEKQDGGEVIWRTTECMLGKSLPANVRLIIYSQLLN